MDRALAKVAPQADLIHRAEVRGATEEARRIKMRSSPKAFDPRSMLAELDPKVLVAATLVETARTMDLELVFISVGLLVRGCRRESVTPAGFARVSGLPSRDGPVR